MPSFNLQNHPVGPSCDWQITTVWAPLFPTQIHTRLMMSGFEKARLQHPKCSAQGFIASWHHSGSIQFLFLFLNEQFSLNISKETILQRSPDVLKCHPCTEVQLWPECGFRSLLVCWDAFKLDPLKTSSATTVATSDNDMQTSEEDTGPKIKIKQFARNHITQAGISVTW